MLLFNTILLLHFLAFMGYLGTLVILWPHKTTAIRDKKGLILGMIILFTGLLLVALKYPVINYYKVVPKTIIFLGIVGINILYDGKPYTKKVYYTLLGLTLLAAGIAVVRTGVTV
ncbi:hypothetical protein [Chitinophaga nivalis]|uniref:Uncharacterized protein n=1 Tax=Chitinophaga nivalis TaxID=2991709 RepID=A0ABT3ITM0_9BACT|nr:hypothetical protein [Chitinophaga nivalis]MCW3463045.1 hypothetical protein [Chitinophaga nivalis]MCW3487265.1 hypothetical protein [Chitinophaga nivalis]